jgi:hypothetical protein
MGVSGIQWKPSSSWSSIYSNRRPTFYFVVYRTSHFVKVYHSISKMPAIQPRGPAHEGHLPSHHPSNPYKFPPILAHAGKLPVKVRFSPPLYSTSLSLTHPSSRQVTPTHIFFFGYEGSDPEVCFQQWFPCPMVDGDGRSFPTAEHYMMWRKAVLMGDLEVAERIRGEGHPSAAK